GSHYVAVAMRDVEAAARQPIVSQRKQKGRPDGRPFGLYISAWSVRLAAQKRRDFELFVPLVVWEQVVVLAARHFGLRLRHRALHGLSGGARRGDTRLGRGFGAQVGLLLA